LKKEKKLLTDIAAVIRSKNAGPYELTFDIIFKNRKHYSAVKASGFFTEERIARLYAVPASAVRKIIYFEPALALKITMAREKVSGSVGDTDVYGAQQHGPLLGLKIPL
jgi:hypothetical protein